MLGGPVLAAPASSRNCAPCASATKMLPSGAMCTSLGCVKWVGGSPATPAVPRVSSTSPSGLNLMTVCPRPEAVGLSPRSARLTASATQTLPSLSTSMPCGQWMSPPPKARTTLPFASSLTIGSRSDSAHELTPQRSPAQMCTPSMSTLPAPHRSPGATVGSVPQSRMVSYGFDPSLIGSTAACSGGPQTAPLGGSGCRQQQQHAPARVTCNLVIICPILDQFRPALQRRQWTRWMCAPALSSRRHRGPR